MAVAVVVVYAYFFSFVSLSSTLTVGVNFTLLNELTCSWSSCCIIETFI